MPPPDDVATTPPVRLEHARDLTVDVVRRVAWEGGRVELTGAALAAIGRQRRAFLAFVDAHADRHRYGGWAEEALTTEPAGFGPALDRVREHLVGHGT